MSKKCVFLDISERSDPKNFQETKFNRHFREK